MALAPSMGDARAPGEGSGPAPGEVEAAAVASAPDALRSDIEEGASPGARVPSPPPT